MAGPDGEALVARDDGDEAALVEGLRKLDEAAFRTLVARHQRAMLHVAAAHLPSQAIAEEVVQDTWMAVIQGIDRFEGRSSLKTWVFRILLNRVRTRATKEGRSVPVSSLHPAPEEGGSEPGVDPSAFFDEGHRWAGHWAQPPRRWDDVPADRLVSGETRGVVDETIRRLPVVQRQVIVLRDVEGWSGQEVCEVLGLTEGNQRVLLHRARVAVRAALSRHLGKDG